MSNWNESALNLVGEFFYWTPLSLFPSTMNEFTQTPQIPNHGAMTIRIVDTHTHACMDGWMTSRHEGAWAWEGAKYDLVS